MLDQAQQPLFRWGEIIQVPRAALCAHGLDGAYGTLYGVVVSSRAVWTLHRSYEVTRKKELRKREKKEEEARRKEEDRQLRLQRIEHNRALQRRGAGEQVDEASHGHDAAGAGRPDSGLQPGAPQGHSRHPLHDREAGGLYIVAPISKKGIKNEKMREVRITRHSRFSGWYIATTLFVTVLDGQMAPIHETERSWGHLHSDDAEELRKQLTATFNAADWEKEKRRSCLNRLTFGFLGR